MQKYIIAGIAVILLAGCAYYWLVMRTPAPVVEPVPQVQVPTTATFATSTYSVTYPIGYTVDPTYAYQGVPNKPILGVKFVIPATMATGTNLSMDSGVSIETLPRAKTCAADIYFYQNVRPHDLIVGSMTYSVASSSDAGAGNFYEEQVFAIPGSQPCTAVRYFIHTTNIDNYPAGAVNPYNRDALIADFDKIRDSLVLSQ